MISIKNENVISAFMMAGLHDAGYDSALEAWGKGAFEMVSSLVSNAPYCEALSAACEEAGLDYPSIFDYDVSSRFGCWFGEHLIATRREPTVSQCYVKLLNLVEAFFLQDEPDNADLKERIATILMAVDYCKYIGSNRSNCTDSNDVF